MEVCELNDGACLRVPLDMLVDAPWGNVRRGKRDRQKYDELKESIRQRGVVQAITVRPNDADNTLEVLAGYGRRSASEENGAADIPVVVKRVDDKEGMAIGLAENLQRQDLTITDEIRIAQSYVSLYAADYAEAARAIGWTERQVRARLKLNDCSEKVLEALESNTIKIGHAEVLCQFTDSLQDNTLTKIVEETWTVEYLKERASKATRLLRHAKFDTKECQSCPHNSSVQSELFDSNIGQSKCGNLPCYRQKSDEWLEKYKSELEKEEGTVYLSVEKPKSDRKTVSAEIVGEEAYTNDCLSCVSRVRIIRGGINADCGDLLDNQCVNLSCFAEKCRALAAEKAGKAKPEKVPAKKGATKKQSGSKATTAKLSSGMEQQARALARREIGAVLLKSERYRLALGLVALSELTGYQPKAAKSGICSDRISVLQSLTVDELRCEIGAAVEHATLAADNSFGRFDGTETVLASARHVKEAEATLTKAWKPTKGWLETYQKGAIQSLCAQKAVGFEVAYDGTNGKGAFKKLMNKKKSELIETILAFEFDWSKVAPKELRDLVTVRK